MKTKRFFFLSQAPTRSSLKQTTWARRLMWRHEALHLLRAHSFCKRKETRECVLTHNNKLWVVQDRSQHVVSDGDYLMVEAFTDDVSIRGNCLERMEQHECSIRRMYTVAPDGLSQPGCASEREKATNSGTLRSRSRSRGESYGGQALGNAEEAPQDMETIGRNNSSAEGHNLLQRKMQRIARNRNLSEETFSRLSPPGNPYRFSLYVPTWVDSG